MGRSAKTRPPSEYFDALRFYLKLVPELDELTVEEREQIAAALKMAMSILLPYIQTTPGPR